MEPKFSLIKIICSYIKDKLPDSTLKGLLHDIANGGTWLNIFDFVGRNKSAGF
jgi:hypothetical protein